MPRPKPPIGGLLMGTWLKDAACAGMAGVFDTTKKWDKELGRRATVTDSCVEFAREVCIECPVMLRCLKDVLAMEEQPEGIWAGMTQEEREEYKNRPLAEEAA